MKNKTLIILLISVTLISATGSVLAMDPVTEDSWIGAFFLKNNKLSQNERLYPFLDIRQANVNQSDLSSNFKWVISNSILVSNLKTYKLMQQRNIDLDELYKLEHLMENYNDNQEILYLELAVMDKLKDEIIKSFEENIKNRDKNSVYNFYHIFLFETESFTVPELETESINQNFDDKFKISENEVKESKINTEYFNKMIPLKPKEVSNYTDSPILSVISYTIDNKEKEKVLDELENAEFRNNLRVEIRQFPLKYQQIEDIYLEVLKLDKDNSDLIKKVRESDYYSMSIRKLFERLQEVN